MSTPPPNLPANRTSINVQGVIALRWVAVLGQFITILAVNQWLSVKLPVKPLFTVLAATAALNLLLIRVARMDPAGVPDRDRRRWQVLLWAIMLFDLLALTAQLYFTGGITNPFSMFFFVNLVLAAMVLPAAWVWSLNVVSIGCVAFLVVWYQPLQLFGPVTWETLAGPNSSDVLKLGALIAYATCATVIVSFTNRISDQLRRQELSTRRLTELRNRNERLDSLGTLAAGAAHELSTPLSSIAIIIKEVEHDLANRNLPDQTFEDIRTIRSQLDRCRGILDRMSVNAGDAINDSIVDTTVERLIEETVKPSLLTMTNFDPDSLVVTFQESSEGLKIKTPLNGLAQAFRAILQNAIDASDKGAAVECVVSLRPGGYAVSISDRGDGMDAATLRRIGEPFFTTKETGKGTGLGIFLARNVIERLGGTLNFESRVGTGTTATINLPAIPPANSGLVVDTDTRGFSFLGASKRLDPRRRKSP